MKKFINKTDQIVDEMLKGMALAHPTKLRKLDGFNVIVRKNLSEKVGLVSGGGAGHEPSHAGFVGKGMLDAAVSGEVFTSPTPDQVLAAVQAVDKKKGVLLITKNYTGDILNFEMAKDLASSDGIQVAQVIVNDDIAVENSTYTTGKRGVAGTVLVHKIAGAAAEAGKSLQDVKAVAEKVIKHTRTMGISLGPCTVPASGKPSFELKPDEIEIGLGIHGEPGVRRDKIRPANELVKELLQQLLSHHDTSKEIALLVNGLGATPLMELYVIANDTINQLKEKGVRVYKSFVGNYMTSLDMPGMSLTIVDLDEELKRYLDAPAEGALFA